MNNLSTVTKSETTTNSLTQHTPLKSEEISRMMVITRVLSAKLEPLIPHIIQSKVKNLYEYMCNVTKSPEGLSQSQMPSSRENVKEVEIEIIKNIASNYLKPNHKIIEIGAGKLNSQNQSYLMQRLPAELLKFVEPIEVNRALIDKNSKALKRVDTLELEKIYGSHTVDRIIGSAVLDTQDEEHLNKTIKQIRSILKDNGLVVHVSTLEPFKDVLLSTYNTKGTICFPWLNDANRFIGLQVISKEDFLNFLQKDNSLSDKEKEFYKWYANLSSHLRELLLNDIIVLKQKIQIEAEELLSRRLIEINPKGIKLIKNKTFFENRIKKALIDTGFNIIECGYRAQSEIIERPKDFPERQKDFNNFSLKAGKFSKGNCCALASDHIRQTVKMHVIVAEVLKKDTK